MRIASLNPNHPGAGSTQPIGTAAAAALPEQDGSESNAHDQSGVRQPTARAVSGSGLANWDPQLNQEISSAQSVDDFLGRLGDMLQSLKADISARLAERQPGDVKLKNKIEQFASAWRARNDATGTSLDGQLHYSGAGLARQRFYVRGLDMRSLQAGGGERLEFSIAGRQSRMTLSIEPGMSQQAILRRLNQTLIAADIRAFMDEDGRLTFEAPQEAWEDVRDTLAIKGGGIRFASGQYNRVQTEAVPDLLDPDNWRVDDIDSLRSTLQEVIDALAQVQQARETVEQAVAEARRRIDLASVPESDEWAASFSRRFETITHQPHYRISTLIAPALASISRARVLSLLAIGSHK